MTLLDDRPASAASAVLAGVLDGQGSFAALTRRLGTPEREWYLVCLDASEVAGAAPSIAAVCPDGVAACGAGAVFVLALYRTPEHAGALARRLSRLVGRDRSAVCWSDPVHDETDPVALARALRRGVALLAGATGVTGVSDRHGAASLAELRPRLVLAELGQLGAGLPVGPAAKLLAHDRTRRTRLVPTVEAYFDAGGDMTEAARRLYLHRNTLRYRLTQVERICGMSLRSPLERLVLELEVRLAGGTEPAET